MNLIIHGDCLKVLPKLKIKPKMIFADPPDNLGLKYDGFDDKWPSHDSYLRWLKEVIILGSTYSAIFWLSFYYKYLARFLNCAEMFWPTIIKESRLIIWRFTFGQHRANDLANGFRPIIRLIDHSTKIYPDAIREQSQRQRNGDKRANPKGRVPDDVWDFPRVVGNAKERRPWIPNQHPEKLIERIVKFSCKPGDNVVDMFAGSGTVNRVCKKLGVNCIGIDISKKYCENIVEENELKLLVEGYL